MTGKNGFPYHFKSLLYVIKRLVIIQMFCDRWHAFLLIQSRLTALLPLQLHDGRSDFRLNDGTILDLTKSDTGSW